MLFTCEENTFNWFCIEFCSFCVYVCVCLNVCDFVFEIIHFVCSVIHAILFRFIKLFIRFILFDSIGSYDCGNRSTKNEDEFIHRIKRILSVERTAETED